MTARSAADAAVAAATRRIALPDGDILTEELRLTEAIGALAPGAHQVSVSLTADDRVARGTARFRWVPPGPVLVPFAIVVTSEVPIAFAP